MDIPLPRFEVLLRVAFGGLQVYQRTVIATGFDVPPWLEWIGTGTTFGFPNSLFIFVPLAALIIFTLRCNGMYRGRARKRPSRPPSKTQCRHARETWCRLEKAPVRHTSWSA